MAFKWSTDIQYWLKNSLPLGYQNQSSAWLLGGTGLRVRGFGHGTFDGNGQVSQLDVTSRYTFTNELLTYNVISTPGMVSRYY
jgi:hypothetical protein